MPLLVPGAPAPWFIARSTGSEAFHFDSVAGRYVVLCFIGTALDPVGAALRDAMLALHEQFNDIQACLFGVSVDPGDLAEQRLQPCLPGIRHFWDFDAQVSRLFGALHDGKFIRMSVILDTRLRVLATLVLDTSPEEHARKVATLLAAAQAADAGITDAFAPVLIVPRVFDTALCQQLIAHYHAGGASDSGFMREVDGKTVGIYDYTFKRRTDKYIDDEQLKQACIHRIETCLLPELRRAFQFRATRIERHVIGCYEGDTSGHFRAHRDNTTKGTAHRRFAVSLVLNSGEFEGGMLRFPEFGQRLYSPPAGGAVVFSCSLLHEVSAVTKGSRYVYLPFLYDEASARIREQNQVFVESDQTLANS